MLRRKPSVFISYRREDSPASAGRIADHLTKFLGGDRVFIDVDHIPAGVDFIAAIDTAVRRADVLLAIIGRSWMTARDEKGQPRLASERDFVRLEIEKAMAFRIPIIPVLVDRAEMPRALDLPESITGLASLNAVTITYERFHADASGLLDDIKRLRTLKAPPTVRNPSVQELPRSLQIHPTVIGLILLLLPLAVVFVGALRPTADSRFLSSLGAYRYSAASDVLTGVMFVLGAALLTYRGYSAGERVAARLGGLAAIAGAVSPTLAPEGVQTIAWWNRYAGITHYAAWALLWLALAVFPLLFFRRSEVPQGDRLRADRIRNVVFLVCGVTILLQMFVISLRSMAGAPIIWLEWLGLTAAGVSWIVKGSGHLYLQRVLARAIGVFQQG